MMRVIPGRSLILTSSVVFVAASLFLILEFIALYAGPNQRFYDQPPARWATDNLINISGAISCVLWLVGFVLLIDWIVFSTFKVWGASRRALGGVYVDTLY